MATGVATLPPVPVGADAATSTVFIGGTTTGGRGVDRIVQLLDRTQWSYVAEHADGYWLHPNGFVVLTDAEQKLLANHFKNKNALIETDAVASHGSQSNDSGIAWADRSRQAGFTPIAVFTNRVNADWAAGWANRVKAERAAGLAYDAVGTSAFIASDSKIGWADPRWDYYRTFAKQGGALNLDVPPYYVQYRDTRYREIVRDQILWTKQNGLKSVWIASPNDSKANYVAHTQFSVTYLEDAGAEPDVYGVEVYGNRNGFTPETREDAAGKTTVAGDTVAGVAYYLLKHLHGDPGTLDITARNVATGVNRGKSVIDTSTVSTAQRQGLSLAQGQSATYELEIENASDWLDYAAQLRAVAIGELPWNVTISVDGTDITAAARDRNGYVFLKAQRLNPNTTRKVKIVFTGNGTRRSNSALNFELMPHKGETARMDVFQFFAL